LVSVPGLDALGDGTLAEAPIIAARLIVLTVSAYPRTLAVNLGSNYNRDPEICHDLLLLSDTDERRKAG
jgi:hypothetical protein